MKRMAYCLIVCILCMLSANVLGEYEEYDILQQLILDIDEHTKESELIEMIKGNDLFYTAIGYNSHWGKIITYEIAYEEEVAKQRHGKTGDTVSVRFRKNDGRIVQAEYFNANAFYADHHKNYEVQVYFEEGYGGLLGSYGHNNNFVGFGKNVYEVPFNTVEEALIDVLENAKLHKD